MLEEWIGEKWHQLITSKADEDYPDAEVHLEDIHYRANIVLRTFAGNPSYCVTSATETEIHSQRSILQRIAGTGNKIQYARRFDDNLSLPDRLAVFPAKQLNQDLYLWLIALSVHDVDQGNWIERNQQRTLLTLSQWPGLKSIYHKLLSEHLKQRPEPTTLPEDEAEQELAIQMALKSPDHSVALRYATRPPKPVILWLHPSSALPDQTQYSQSERMNQPEPNLYDRKNNNETKKKKAERVESPNGKGGLISFRLESLWSWTEFSQLDRSSTEESDDDPEQTFNDLDKISLAKDSETTSSRLKVDLDLPSCKFDDIYLGEGIAVPEWDYKQQKLLKDYCRIVPMRSKDMVPCGLPVRLSKQASFIRRQFETIQPERQWLNRQRDGTELDLENYIHLQADKLNGIATTEVKVFRDYRNNRRDLSCLLLADLSLSTDAYVNDNDRVIDIIKDSLFLFSEALQTMTFLPILEP